MKKTIVVPLLYILALSCLFSQTTGDNLVEINIPRPIPPGVSSMMQYVDYPVDLCYGMVDVEIPLFNIVEGDIHIPLTLSYRSSGTKAKEYSGWVGLGWTLNCAPSISCSVQGKPDSKSYFEYPWKSGEYNWYLWELTKGNYGYDAEPDIYYYRLLDRSGKIVFDNSTPRKPHTIPYEPLDIKGSSIPTEITDDRGFTYEFGAVLSEKDDIDLQWGVTKITAPNKKDCVTFEYDKNVSILHIEDIRRDLLIVEGNLQDRTLNPPASDFFPTGSEWPFIYEGNVSGGNYIETYYPINITKYSTGYRGEIGSKYSSLSSPRAQYSYPQGSVYLREHCLKAIRTSTLDIEFELENQAGSSMTDHGNRLERIRIFRHSDHSLLREIVFSVGIYLSSPYTLDKLSKVQVKDPNGTVIEQYTMEYYDEGKVGLPRSMWADYWGYRQMNSTSDPNMGAHEYYAKNMKLRHHSEVYGLIDYTIFQVGRGDVGAWEDAARAGMLKSVTYPTGRKSTFEYEQNHVVESVNKKKWLGGMRIKKIREQDPIGNSELVREFEYAPPTILCDSSLKHYTYTKILRRWNACDVQLNYYVSSPCVQSPPSVYYDMVTEYRTNTQTDHCGKTVYKYTPNLKTWEFIEGTTIVLEHDNSFEQGASMPGLLKEKHVYKKEPGDTGTYLMVQSELNQYHSFLKTTIGGMKTYRNVEFQGDYISETSQISMADDLANAYLGFGKYGISNHKYDIPVGACRLASKEIRTYDPTGNHYTSRLTTYEYANESHLYPTKVTETNSNGTTRITRTYYPQDLSFASQDAAQEQARLALVDDNRLSTVLKRTTQAGGDTWTVQMRYALFADMALPRSLTSGYEGLWEEQIACTRYDSKGHLQEYTGKDGLTTVLLWGYGNLYPVAEIRGATYAEVAGALGEALIGRLSSASAPASGDLQSVRSLGAGQPHVQITTYTYDPIWGMASMTDPRGITTYYAYDDFGRLKEAYIVEDGRKKVIETYSYHYAN